MLLLGDTRAFFTLYAAVAAAGLRPHQLDPAGVALTASTYRSGTGRRIPPRSGRIPLDPSDPSDPPDRKRVPSKLSAVGEGGLDLQDDGSRSRTTGLQDDGSRSRMTGLQDDVQSAVTGLRLAASLALERADVIMTTRRCAELPGFPLSSFDAIIHYIGGRRDRRPEADPSVADDNNGGDGLGPGLAPARQPANSQDQKGSLNMPRGLAG